MNNSLVEIGVKNDFSHISTVLGNGGNEFETLWLIATDSVNTCSKFGQIFKGYQ